MIDQLYAVAEAANKWAEALNKHVSLNKVKPDSSMEISFWGIDKDNNSGSHSFDLSNRYDKTMTLLYEAMLIAYQEEVDYRRNLFDVAMKELEEQL